MANSDRAVAARYLHDALGMTWDRVGDLLHVDPTTASRDAKALGELDTTPEQLAVDDLEALLATQELDDHRRFQAGVAKRLATRLDKVSVSDKAADALAMPQIAKELRAVVAEIMGASQDDKDWLRIDVYGAVGDATDPGAQDSRPAGSEDRG